MNINTHSGFQFYGEMVIPDGYLLDPALHQCFIEFCQMCSLLGDEILKVIDSFYLLISCGSIDGGLLAEFSKPENLIRDFVIGLFAEAPAAEPSAWSRCWLEKNVYHR